MSIPNAPNLAIPNPVGVQLGPRPPVTNLALGYASGYFLSGATSPTLVVDSYNYITGNQALVMTTDGTAGSTYLKTNNIAPAINMVGKIPRAWVRLPNPGDIANINNCYLYMGSDNIVANYYAFNSVLTGFAPDFWGNETYANGWMGVTMTMGEAVVNGSPNRGAISSIWFRVNDAHGAPVQVAFGGVELVPEPAGGVVSFTFDDGRLTQYTQARQILSQFRFPATAYLIRDVIDNPYFSPSTMTSEMLWELQEYHGWEIAAHCDTVAAHNLPNGLVDLTPAQLDQELRGCRSWLTANGYRGASSMALPKGKHNQAVYNACRKYFTSTRGTYSASNGSGWIKHESYPPTDRNKLVPFYVYQNTTVNQMTTAVNSAWANKEWLIFVFHDLLSNPAANSDNQYSITNFQSLVNYVAGVVSGGGLSVRTVGDVIAHGM